MSEVHRYQVVTMLSDAGNKIAYDPHGPWIVMASAFDEANRLFLDAAERCVASERREKELQQRLTAADERADVLESVSVKQAALLDELGIPLEEVDDLFGETLKNAKRYEYLRSVMAVENFPAPHPTWSESSEVESKRIDDLCDAALKPAEGRGDE
ncbi:hypothetical protein P2T68_16870 [Pseudomonas sp. G11]|uniref:hypothetical protein n=1 Tax=Pseudomonas sp. G11 TaxID=528343 RepID=UPI002402B37E|nr:hypothetical protein [Pseudomonas sp. G11]WEX18917.1 hypothetical protein P2T68_16870 [Pseudomonas sp. G11]